MPDLLAHALVAYTLGRVLSWRYVWLTPGYITVVMASAFISEMTKIKLLVSSRTVAHLLGVPFDWSALHMAGGAVVAILIGVVAVVPHERVRVGILLAVGAASHLLADALLINPSGRSYAILWPLTRWHPPTPGQYLSTQAEPTVVAALIAVVVWLVTTYRNQQRTA
jgi:hypothetical protein